MCLSIQDLNSRTKFNKIHTTKYLLGRKTFSSRRKLMKKPFLTPVGYFRFTTRSYNSLKLFSCLFCYTYEPGDRHMLSKYTSLFEPRGACVDVVRNNYAKPNCSSDICSTASFA